MVKKAKSGKSARQIALEYENQTGEALSEHTVRRTLKTKAWDQWNYCVSSLQTVFMIILQTLLTLV